MKASYARESFAFLDVSPPFSPPAASGLFSAVTALVISHEALQDPSDVHSALHAALSRLLCPARANGVRLFYRLEVTEAPSAALTRLHAVLADFPFDGLSVRLSEELLRSPAAARNFTLAAAAAARRSRAGARVMLEQPDLRCGPCAWMGALLGRVDFLFLPTFADNDCPEGGFASAAATAVFLRSRPDLPASRLVLGAPLFGLRVDCLALQGRNCTRSPACPQRLSPRPSRLPPSPARQQDGHFSLLLLDPLPAVLAKLRLSRKLGLGGFALVRINDLNLSASEHFWSDVAKLKEAQGHETDSQTIFSFVLFLLLLIIIF